MISPDKDKNTLRGILNSLETDNKNANSQVKSEEVTLSTAAKKEGETRSFLTLSFLMGFFALLILFAIFVWGYNGRVVAWVIELKAAGVENAVDYLKPLELEKVLSIIITALGTSLGFIIGYYFKEKHSS
ncbi:hypothetical protein I4990_04765 [Providencia alcalifaciens]|uniref:hypothetical protein n=1 Tax=Providencia alcalifaciens TaxID=126385 RepID=UPI0018C704B9|nr:hypothetical protein [Providencia alcalifaciens]MBG5882265.1 hypothetical protein [Providencia alcalifaciens]